MDKKNKPSAEEYTKFFVSEKSPNLKEVSKFAKRDATVCSDGILKFLNSLNLTDLDGEKIGPFSDIPEMRDYRSDIRSFLQKRELGQMQLKVELEKAKKDLAEDKDGKVTEAKLKSLLTNQDNNIKEMLKEHSEYLSNEIKKGKESGSKNIKSPVFEILGTNYMEIDAEIRSTLGNEKYRQSYMSPDELSLEDAEKISNILTKGLNESQKRIPHTVLGILILAFIFQVFWAIYKWGNTGAIAVGITIGIIFAGFLIINTIFPNLFNWIISISEFVGKISMKFLEKISTRKS